MKTASGTRRMACLALLAALTLTACEIRAHADLVIEEDETGSLSIELSVDEEMSSLMGSELGGGPILDEEMIPSGWRAEMIDEDGFEGFRATVPFESFAGLRAVLGEFAGEDSPAEFEVLAFLADSLLTREGDTFRFHLTLPPSMSDVLGEGLEGSPIPMDLAMLDSVFDLRFSLKLPGEVVSHNADADAGGILIWSLSLADGGRSLDAESQLPSAGLAGMLGWLAVVASLVLVIVLVVSVWFLKRQGPAPARPSDSGLGAEDSGLGGEDLT